MLRWNIVVLISLLLQPLLGLAKDKKKLLLPIDVLQARTVTVIVDPNAGFAVTDPAANRVAREDVEKALMKWGRYQLAVDSLHADLVITVEKGTGKLVDGTIGGVPMNGRPITAESTDSATRVGVRQGNPGSIDSGDPNVRIHPQIEAGHSQDAFLVYRGSQNESKRSPLDAPPVWRYTGEAGLQSPGLPAIEAFRSAIHEAEKQAAHNP